MKTAILLSGKLEHFRDTYNNISQRLLSSLGDYDVFISTWDLSENDKEDLISLYNPKVLHTEVLNEDTKYLFEGSYNYQKSLELEPKYGSPNSLYMWYKIGRGLNIINEYSGFNNIEYDLVIRLRTDFFFTNRLTQHHIDLVLNNTILLGPHCTEKSHLGFSHASDNFIMFPWKYISVFKNIEKYYSNVWKNYQYFSPENLLYETLKQQALNFTNSDIKLGRIYKNSCILWAPNGTTYDGYPNETILNLTSDFSIDNNSNIIYDSNIS